MRLLGLIPARGGSKAIPRKNLVLLAGLPLITYTIDAARASAQVTRVIVTTDDPLIAQTASEAGAEVPFLRPSVLAQDDTPMLEVIRHALDWLEQREQFKPDAVLLLQPTSPFRTTRHIDEAIRLFRDSDADALVSVVSVPHSMVPEALMVERGGWLYPYLSDSPILQRQDKSRYWARNGPAIFLARTNYLSTCAHMYVGRVIGYSMSARQSIDIDTPEDLDLAEMLMMRARGSFANPNGSCDA